VYIALLLGCTFRVLLGCTFKARAPLDVLLDRFGGCGFHLYGFPINVLKQLKGNHKGSAE
jgi:hypothetical protein